MCGSGIDVGYVGSCKFLYVNLRALINIEISWDTMRKDLISEERENEEPRMLKVSRRMSGVDFIYE